MPTNKVGEDTAGKHGRKFIIVLERLIFKNTLWHIKVAFSACKNHRTLNTMKNQSVIILDIIHIRNVCVLIIRICILLL